MTNKELSWYDIMAMNHSFISDKMYRWMSWNVYTYNAESLFRSSKVYCVGSYIKHSHDDSLLIQFESGSKIDFRTNWVMWSFILRKIWVYLNWIVMHSLCNIGFTWFSPLYALIDENMYLRVLIILLWDISS